MQKTHMTDKKDSNWAHNLMEEFDKQKRITTAADWEKVRKRIFRERNKQRFLRFARNAAAILLPLFLVWQYVLLPSLHSDKEQYVEVASSASGISKIVLPDGSLVWLNTSSKLIYPQKFTAKNRTVKLEGEGYFSVKSDKKKRFNVIVNENVNVSAYGTEFNVISYPQADQYEVLLAHGYVEVTLPKLQRSQLLKAGEEALISLKTGKINVRAADIYIQTAWKDGKIVFYREKLGDIAKKLSKRFEVTIEFADPDLKEQIFTGTFTNEGITEILDLFKQSSPINYTVIKNSANKQRTILIKHP